MRWDPAPVLAVRELLDALDALAPDGECSDPEDLARVAAARATVEELLPPVVRVRHADGTIEDCIVEPGDSPGSWRILVPAFLVTGDALIVDRPGSYALEWLE